MRRSVKRTALLPKTISSRQPVYYILLRDIKRPLASRHKTTNGQKDKKNTQTTVGGEVAIVQ